MQGAGGRGQEGRRQGGREAGRAGGREAFFELSNRRLHRGLAHKMVQNGIFLKMRAIRLHRGLAHKMIQKVHFLISFCEPIP